MAAASVVGARSSSPRPLRASTLSKAITRIDPSLPLCWEDDRTLRFGFDRAAARIPDPSPAAQRLIGLLRRGVPVGELQEAARRVETTPQERRELLELLAPVLVATPPVPLPSAGSKPPKRIAVFGRGSPAVSMRSALERAGLEAFDGAAVSTHGVYDRGRLPGPRGAPELAVLIERFHEPLDLGQAQLSQRVPHLFVGFGDRGVRVGPIVSADGAPCLGCVGIHSVEADPALPRMAAQLIGQLPASETPAVAEAVAALSALSLLRWAAGDAELASAQWWLPVTDGLPAAVPELRRLREHPECGCVSLRG